MPLNLTRFISRLGAASVTALALTALGGVAAPPASAGAAKPKASASDPAADKIADKVQAFYDKTRTFRANFKQRYWIKSYNRFKDSRGKVVFQKPGKMSWRYTSNGNRVVSDGKELKVYEQDNRQMYKQSVKKSQYPAALAFLVGEGNLKKSFSLKTLDAARARFKGGHVLVGTPREPTPAYQKMVLYVDGKTSQVRRVMLIDAQGNRNRFDFLEPEVNVKPSPGEFSFSPPRGTRIVKP